MKKSDYSVEIRVFYLPEVSLTDGELQDVYVNVFSKGKQISTGSSSGHWYQGYPEYNNPKIKSPFENLIIIALCQALKQAGIHPHDTVKIIRKHKKRKRLSVMRFKIGSLALRAINAVVAQSNNERTAILIPLKKKNIELSELYKPL